MSRSIMFNPAAPAFESLAATSVGTSAAALLGARLPRWRPGLSAYSHSEIFANSDEASGAGFALALARDALKVAARQAGSTHEDRRQVMWVQDKASMRLTGRPYRPGLPPELRHRLIHVEARTPEDALFALEEGLRCRDLAFVLGEIAGNPRALTFTTSRRLSLAAEKHGVPLWLVRLDAEADLSSARMRWKVTAAPSPSPRWNAGAPGHPTWQAELFRARLHPPGKWSFSDDSGTLIARQPHSEAEEQVAPDHVDLACSARGRSLAAL